MEKRLILSSALGVNEQYVEMSTRMVKHYSQYPITEFVLTLNATQSQIRSFRDVLRQLGIKAKVFEKTQSYDNRRQARWANQRQAYISRTYNYRDWKICVDADEILIINEVLYDTLDSTDASYFLAFIVDMVHRDMHLGASYEQDLLHRLHRKCFLTQTTALAQKVPLARVFVLVEGAAHNVTRRYRREKCFEKVLPLHHFKWGSGVYERLLERYDTYRQLGISYYDESMRFCEILNSGVEHLFEDNLYSVRFSVKKDKTGGYSLQLDSNGDHGFFRY